MKLINKQLVNLPDETCHYIIQERNKFLIDYNIPRLTNTEVIPSSHLPINFIKPIEDIIFKMIKTNIFPTIQEEYKENIDNFEINTVFFVENSYEYNRKYINIENIDHSYGFIIILNDSIQYTGGELIINNKKILNENENIKLFSNSDKIDFNNILSGEQNKIIGYINNKLIKHKFNNDILLYNNPHVSIIKNIIELDCCDALYDTFTVEKCEQLKKEERIEEINNNDICYEFSIDNYKNIYILQKINDYLQNCILLNSILNKYNIKLQNMLSYKIEIIKKDKPSYYFSPLIKKTESTNGIELFYNNKESKFTLMINLNTCDSNLVFIDTNKKYTFEKGNGILIPNNCLYNFYINLNNESTEQKYYGYFLIVTFF